MVRTCAERSAARRADGRACVRAELVALGSRIGQRRRGRVVGMRATAILGARPIGAPVVGWIGEALGPRYALGVGAVAALGVALWARKRMLD